MKRPPARSNRNLFARRRQTLTKPNRFCSINDETGRGAGKSRSKIRGHTPQRRFRRAEFTGEAETGRGAENELSRRNYRNRNWRQAGFTAVAPHVHEPKRRKCVSRPRFLQDRE